jgi:hypothetical protein
MNDTEVAALIASIQRKSTTTPDIEKFKAFHRVRIREEAGKYIAQFEDFFDTLNGLVKGLNYVKKEGWSQSKNIHYLFYPETLKTLHRAFEDLQDGYYDEAEMLHRSVYETILRIVFLYQYPEAWESVFYDKPGQRAFKASKVPQENGLDWEFLYSLMCKISHSKVYSTLLTLTKISREGQHDPITLEYKFDKKFCWLPINTSIFLLTTLLHFFTQAFLEEMMAIMPAAEYARTLKVELALFGLIAGNPGAKFAALTGDIKKLGEIVKTGAAIKVSVKPNESKGPKTTRVGT